MKTQENFILSLFSSLNKNGFLWKIHIHHSHLSLFFLFLNFYCCGKAQKKTNEQIPRKAGYRKDSYMYAHTDGCTGKHELIRISLPGSKNSVDRKCGFHVKCWMYLEIEITICQEIPQLL